ncbi:MAG TPA: nicotinate-nucleotide--dimethylbenzimidazole phosphoribosyltransferase [Kofleriaceae bacterium]|nr:nicotinate-nucleotide--dimethylbenzimidazole phosphoribosyltransferase [Kofleriaceae bacterium]
MSVLRHVIESISPASEAHAGGARQNVARAGAPLLERLAAALGGAQHTARPRAARRTIVVCAGDHGAGDPGIALGAAHPTVIAARAIADGTAALAGVARAAGAPIVLVDAGVAEPAELPALAVRLGRGPSRDLLREPAMTVVDAALALEAGIALAVSLVDAGLDVLAIGAIGVGAEVASAALLGAAAGAGPAGLGDPGAEAAGAHGAALGAAGAGALERLAALGGPDTAVLAGLILGAASMNVPTVLDGYATGAAALAAAAFAPAVRGSLIAAHAGSFTQPRILAHLGLAPLFEVGLGHGEGTGAAMALPLIDQVASLASRG